MNKSYILHRAERNLIQAEVVLGRLESDCRGYGICKIVEMGSLKNSCSSSYVEIEGLSERLISFHFPAAEADFKMLKKYFIDMEFILEQYFSLPDFVCDQLDLEKRKIANGKYYVHSTRQGLTVKFPLV
jgi:hypothetical protein